MAATINIQFQVKGLLNGESFAFPTGGLYGPATITTSADLLCIKELDVATSTVTTLLTVGSGGDVASALAFAFIASGACRITWRGSASDADNSAIVLPANVPMFLPGYQTLPYQTTSSNRIDETAAAIDSFKCWQNTGSTIKVRCLAFA